MSEYSSLKATINANVKTNGNQEITGSIMNSVLNAMVDSLGAGYQFIGVATPTNPGSAQTPDYKCFYLATTPGTYTNLGGLVVADGEVALLKYDTSWTKEVTGIATEEQLNQLVHRFDKLAPVTTTSVSNPGGYINNSGVEATSSSGYRVYYYDIDDSKNYHFHCYFGSLGLRILHFYDADNNYLGNKIISTSNSRLEYEDDFTPISGSVRMGINTLNDVAQLYEIGAIDLQELDERVERIEENDSPALRIRFSNSLKCSAEMSSRISQLNASGVEVTDPNNIGVSGNVTKINLGILMGKKTYIKFKFRLNENINIARPDLNLSGVNSDLLNIFKFVCRYSERIGIAPYAFTQRTSYSENGHDVNNPFAKVQGNAIFGSVWNVRERQNLCLPDGWTNKLFVGERVFGIRYVGEDISTLNGNLFIKNDGQALSIHNASNSINYAFTLSNYADINSLITAIKADGHFDVSVFGSLDRTPQEMMVFDDICIINTRGGEDNNDWFYINLANNEQWHTFEWMYDPAKYPRPVAQIDGVGTYINFLNSDIFNATTPVVIYIGGTELGSNVAMDYKDIDVRIADTLDAEMLINERSGFSIVSKESPRVLVYTMHNVVDDIAPNVSDRYTTSLDKLYWVFNLAKKKGYQFISINDLCQFVKGNRSLPSRSILFINDDIRLYIYLNRILRAAYSRFGSRITLALQNNSATFEYNGTTYQVRELVERMRASHFDVVSHSDHTEAPNTFTDWEIWKANFERSENLLIDDTIHVYVGGAANPFFCEELETNGVKIGLTTTSGKVTRASYDMRIPRYYVDNVESLNAIKSEII